MLGLVLRNSVRKRSKTVSVILKKLWARVVQLDEGRETRGTFKADKESIPITAIGGTTKIRRGCQLPNLQARLTGLVVSRDGPMDREWSFSPCSWNHLGHCRAP